MTERQPPYSGGTEDYVKDALRTNCEYEAALERLHDPKILQLLHGVMGVGNKAGELLSQVKGHLFYGKALDLTNIMEEHGDLFWFLAIIADACDYDFSLAMRANIAKLKARYPAKFTETHARTRNLVEERAALDQFQKENPYRDDMEARKK